jgi:hypothetical protein
MLEVPQRQHFAVHRVHAIERFLNAQLQLSLDGGLTRAGELAEQLCGQRCGARLGQGAAVERNLPAGVAGLDAQVLPMHQRQLLPRREPKPEEKGHFRILQVRCQLLAGFQIGFLDDIRGIDASPHARIQPQLDHTFQPAAIARK